MSSLLRQVGLLGVATALSWWMFLGVPRSVAPIPEPQVESVPDLTLDLTPYLEPSIASVPEEKRDAASPAPEPVSSVLPDSSTAPDPVETVEVDAPPRESGDPDGESDEGVAQVSEEAPPETDVQAVESNRADAAEFRASTELLAAAAAEFSGETRQGFQTVLLASPGDQLDIARSFAEEIVLVPKSALDPDEASPDYFRLDEAGTVELVRGRPQLSSYRQYRDLFDYEYARLPKPVRTLRRSVLARSEVYLFAALIPLEEWAVVIGRRREALVESGRTLSDVKSFTLRYLRLSDRSFDLAVEEIRFKGGERFRPAEMERKGG